MFLFYVLTFFKKGTLFNSGGKLFKGGQNLRKYGIRVIKCPDMLFYQLKINYVGFMFFTMGRQK